ncbi:roadblock/LC7 domain-containing protein [Candidatus Protofrankia californiensis]|uniref:roadblock/LC7 domain-containing protein n=1 Tax=Candidatus Protofrankia californiensis TaxID=1839754 RepID=UPI001041393E|nr:roadblock/LC7 domain-containing protein [Candidatus Protofrankia californiensis]
MIETVPQNPELDGLVNNFVRSIPGVASAIVVSADGILLAVCDGFLRERAEQLGAVSSGLLGLTIGVATLMEAGSVTRTIVEMDYGTLLLTAIGDDACLSVLTAKTCEIGVVGYEMTRLVTQARDCLVPTKRDEARHTATGSST